MQHTSQYQLNQWAKTDRIQMEDFNTDNLKIEQALAALADSLTGKADSATVSALQTALANVSPVVKLLSATLAALRPTGTSPWAHWILTSTPRF